jgi:hypothetical protein
VTEAVTARSMKRSPSCERVPWESLRWMTGPRSERSEALLVGSTPSTVTNVHSAGQILSRLLANRRWWRVRLLFRPALQQLSHRGLDRLHLCDQPLAVLVLGERLPQPPGERQAGIAEPPLLGQVLGAAAKVAQQVLPADLAAFGVEVVVGPPAVRAGDPVEVIAEQLIQIARVMRSKL